MKLKEFELVYYVNGDMKVYSNNSNTLRNCFFWEFGIRLGSNKSVYKVNSNILTLESVKSHR